MIVLIKDRKEWIDALRAMAMIFVVFGHQAQWCDVFFLYTTPIKIPLFFAISGYLFNDRSGAFKVFFLRWFHRLIIPFFCLVTIPALVLSFHTGIGFLFESWRRMISGESYWFITCLIVAEVIHFFIRKISRNTIWVIICSIFCVLLGFELNNNNLGNYAKINTAFISQVYFLVGFLLKKNEIRTDAFSKLFSISCFILYLFLCFISQFIFDNISFDCNQNKYYNLPYCMMLIVLGCSSCFWIAKRCRRFPSWITLIGQNTFVLYLWAGYSLLLFVLFSKIGIYVPRESLLVSILQTIWATVSCIGISIFINKYFPFIIGHRNKTLIT